MPTDNPYDSILVTIPERSDDVLTGSDFGKSISNKSESVRESIILKEFLSGNVPSFLRNLCDVEITVGQTVVTVFVLPDYLAVGNDEDYLRLPMTPRSAQIIADAFNCFLPTRKMVNEIWKNSFKLSPQPLPPGAKMVTVDYFIQHNQVINNTLTKQSIQPGTLIAGHKKDIVLTRNPLMGKNIAIYGWHQLNGVPIQGLNCTSHVVNYVDYSQCIRLICKIGLLNGQAVDLTELLKTDKTGLLSDEGLLSIVKYPI